MHFPVAAARRAASGTVTVSASRLPRLRLAKSRPDNHQRVRDADRALRRHAGCRSARVFGVNLRRPVACIRWFSGRAFSARADLALSRLSAARDRARPRREVSRVEAEFHRQLAAPYCCPTPSGRRRHRPREAEAARRSAAMSRHAVARPAVGTAHAPCARIPTIPAYRPLR